MLKSLVQKIANEFEGQDRYRPERHYMRGPGPKSQKVEAIGDAKNVKA